MASTDVETTEETFLDIVVDFHEPEKCHNKHNTPEWDMPCSGAAVAKLVSCAHKPLPVCLNTVLKAQEVIVTERNHTKCHKPCWRIEPL
jgi:hypothetical protein